TDHYSGSYQRDESYKGKDAGNGNIHQDPDSVPLGQDGWHAEGSYKGQGQRTYHADGTQKGSDRTVENSQIDPNSDSAGFRSLGNPGTPPVSEHHLTVTGSYKASGNGADAGKGNWAIDGEHGKGNGKWTGKFADSASFSVTDGKYTKASGEASG